MKIDSFELLLYGEYNVGMMNRYRNTMKDDLYSQFIFDELAFDYHVFVHEEQLLVRQLQASVCEYLMVNEEVVGFDRVWTTFP